jgi:hypothetical protein
MATTDLTYRLDVETFCGFPAEASRAVARTSSAAGEVRS